MLPGSRPDALREEETEPPELCRCCAAVGVVLVGEAEGARGLRTGEHDMCLAPDDGARGGRCCLSDAACGGGGGGGSCVWAFMLKSWTTEGWAWRGCGI